jgi:hypothetical protein
VSAEKSRSPNSRNCRSCQDRPSSPRSRTSPRLARLMHRHEGSARLVGVLTSHPGQRGADAIAFPAPGGDAVTQVLLGGGVLWATRIATAPASALIGERPNPGHGSAEHRSAGLMPSDPRRGIVPPGRAGWPERDDHIGKARGYLAFRPGPHTASEVSRFRARGGRSNQDRDTVPRHTPERGVSRHLCHAGGCTVAAP